MDRLIRSLHAASTSWQLIHYHVVASISELGVTRHLVPCIHHVTLVLRLSTALPHLAIRSVGLFAKHSKSLSDALK